ncbi:hypothetical protein DAPPUDRAFT_249187 [Daphnia pulex]|uniref:Uncharacterized protein n=1 Tax=Daphnia pulex TaxID=6669 RepID=E9GW28_DAPPU|nr:hypothetical protein DAPPUDRAFT_249187 [Daphnia pulex]|eukprot:EFX76341.1 hypothetical protein DAPPUDRAFT_249187 [Daphnia pulex]
MYVAITDPTCKVEKSDHRVDDFLVNRLERWFSRVVSRQCTTITVFTGLNTRTTSALTNFLSTASQNAEKKDRRISDGFRKVTNGIRTVFYRPGNNEFNPFLLMQVDPRAIVAHQFTRSALKLDNECYTYISSFPACKHPRSCSAERIVRNQSASNLPTVRYDLQPTLRSVLFKLKFIATLAVS